MSLEQLTEVSRRYGSDPAYVLLGGGNTSFKDGSVMYVKASGHALGKIGADGFVRMDLSKMEAIWHKQYSCYDRSREAEVLKDMMECRMEGENARPSVEALLHALLPFPFVVHLHPALVNGLTCSQQGEAAAHRLFPEALWIELVKPGFILAGIVRERYNAYMKSTGRKCSVILLQNHGVFVGGESVEEIDQIYADLLSTLEQRLVRKPDFTQLEVDNQKFEPTKSALAQYTGEPVFFDSNREFSHFLADERSFAGISSAFTPDHIVYAGFKPLWVAQGADVVQAYKVFEAENGVKPKIICVEKLGVFSIGVKPRPLFFDTAAISVYAESFGGPRFMDQAMIDFIRTWEVEQYRSNVGG